MKGVIDAGVYYRFPLISPYTLQSITYLIKSFHVSFHYFLFSIFLLFVSYYFHQCFIFVLDLQQLGSKHLWREPVLKIRNGLVYCIQKEAIDNGRERKHNGTMEQWLWRWISSPGVPCLNPLGGSKFDSAFHPSEVDHMSTRNFWEVSGKK